MWSRHDLLLLFLNDVLLLLLVLLLVLQFLLVDVILQAQCYRKQAQYELLLPLAWHVVSPYERETM
jgi:hypothetical protein